MPGLKKRVDAPPAILAGLSARRGRPLPQLPRVGEDDEQGGGEGGDPEDLGGSRRPRETGGIPEGPDEGDLVAPGPRGKAEEEA